MSRPINNIKRTIEPGSLRGSIISLTLAIVGSGIY